MGLRILSIDGGGLRGIIPIQLLKEIEKITHQPIIECFDVFAGTSTGGIIVAALTVGEKGKAKYSLDDVENLYLEYGKVIFPSPHSPFSLFFKNYFLNLFRPRFRDRGISEVFSHYLSEKRLSDCIKPIFIPTYNVAENRPVFFKSRYVNPSSDGFDPNKNARLFDICRATSAGPTYLPSHYFKYSRDFSDEPYYPNCIDGGVFINNPAIGVLVEVLKHKEDIIYGAKSELLPKDVFLLSLGTGTSNDESSISRQKGKKWGKLQWISPLIDVMMYGNSQAIDYQINELLPKGNYLRIQFSIDAKFSDMADSSPEATLHWKQRVNEEFLSNQLKLDELKYFIEKAGL